MRSRVPEGKKERMKQKQLEGKTQELTSDAEKKGTWDQLPAWGPAGWTFTRQEQGEWERQWGDAVNHRRPGDLQGDMASSMGTPVVWVFKTRRSTAHK